MFLAFLMHFDATFDIANIDLVDSCCFTYLVAGVLERGPGTHQQAAFGCAGSFGGGASVSAVPAPE